MPPSHTLSIKTHGATDVGKTRENNEDNFAIFDFASNQYITEADKSSIITPKGTLLIVSDGMGGANAGEVASQMTIDIIVDALKEGCDDNKEGFSGDRRVLLENAVQKAHSAILENSQSDLSHSGMGATVTAIWLWDREAAVVQVGDSRLYRLDNDHISRITHDQSPVGRLLRSGHLTAEQARLHPQRNLLDQALGASLPEIAPDAYSFPLHAGESYLLCTDGLSDALADSAIYKMYQELTPGAPSSICSRLIKEADTRYGQDNITALLCRVC